MKTILPFLLFFSFHLQAQQDTWEHFYKGDKVNDVLETTTDLWIATCVGLVKIDKATEQRELLTIFNSDLNNDYIRSVIQDKNGIIWIKSNVGISKFDGINWIHFTPNNSNLEHDDPRYSYYGGTDQLQVDGQNRIWTKNNNRLLYYSGGTWTLTYQAIANTIFLVNPNGTAWLKYGGASGVPVFLKRFDGTNWITEDPNLPNNIDARYASMVSFDSNDNLWLTVNAPASSSESGLLKWDIINQDWTFHLRDTSIDFSGLGHVVDKDDNIWMYSTNEESFIKFSLPNNWEIIPLPDTLQSIDVYEVIITTEGIAFSIIKLGTSDYQYLGFLNQQNQFEFVDLPTYFAFRIKKMLQLEDGSIFLGDLRAHPAIYKNGIFESIDIGNTELPSDNIHTILGEDDLGQMYFNIVSPNIYSSEIKNFSIYNGQDWETIDYPYDHTGLAKLKPNGEILLSGYNGSSFEINVYKNGIWEEVNTQAQPFYNQKIMELEIDASGAMWLVTEETHSLFKFKDEVWTEYHFPNYGLPNQSFQIWGFDNEDQIHIDQRYSYETYIHNYTTDSFELRFDPADMFPIFSYPSYANVEMVQQQNGNLFFQKEDRFIQHDGNEFIKYDTSNSPLPLDITFYNIQLDNSDNIWLATSHGLYKFDGESEWENFTPYNSPLADMLVTDIFIDKNDKVWITNFRSGFYTFPANQSPPTSNSNIASQNDFSFNIYPNPFSSRTTVSYDLKTRDQVKIEILDLTGRVLQTISEGYKEAGKHQLGIYLPQLTPGIYFCKIIVGNQQQVLKVAAGV